jgi:hypothetical protein
VTLVVALSACAWITEAEYQAAVDVDLDGAQPWPFGADCDDRDRFVGPGNQLGPQPVAVYPDADGDGLGFGPGERRTCVALDGFVQVAGDCDDTQALVGDHSWADTDGDGLGGAEEAGCGGVFEPGDCDDADASVGAVYPAQWRDADGDGFGSPSVERTDPSCVLTEGYVADDTDCDDADRRVGGPIPWYVDADQDLDGVDGPGTVLACGQPSDASGPMSLNQVDCDDTDPRVGETARQFPDGDGDGYGDAFAEEVSAQSCAVDEGFVTNAGDCDDGDASRNPTTMWFEDRDQDGFGAGAPLQQCAAFGPDGPLAPSDSDCDDADPTIGDHGWLDLDGDAFGGEELAACGGVYVGLDCDDADPLVNPLTRWALDADGDGFGVGFGEVVVACVRPDDHVLEPTSAEAQDCADDDPLSNPLTSWWPDGDQDGAGAAGAAPVVSCVPPGLWSRDASDCDDTDRTVIVAAMDVDGDGFGGLVGQPGHCPGGVLDPGWTTVQGDCDDGDPDLFPGRSWYHDGDGDGAGGALIAVACEVADDLAVTSGGDCDDQDPRVRPGAVDPARDGVDADCDGTDLDGDGDGLPDLGCPAPLIHEVTSQAELDAFGPSVVGCDLVVLYPSAVPYRGFTTVAQGYWAPLPGVVVDGGDQAGVRVNNDVVLEGLELRDFRDGAVLLEVDADVTLSDVRITGGAGVVDAVPAEDGRPTMRSVALLGSRFEDTDSILVARDSRGSDGPVGVADLVVVDLVAEGVVTTESALDVSAGGAAQVAGFTFLHGAALDVAARIAARGDLLVAAVTVEDSLVTRALELASREGRLDVVGVRVEDNGVPLGVSQQSLVALQARDVTVDSLAVLRNEIVGGAVLVDLCGPDSPCGEVPTPASWSWVGGELVGNHSSVSSVAVRAIGDGLLQDVAIHQQQGKWLAVSGAVVGRLVTLGGRPDPTGLVSPERLSMEVGSSIELVDSILDYRDGDPPPLSVGGGQLRFVGSLLEDRVAAACATQLDCDVSGGSTFVGAPGLRRSHAGMPEHLADARQSTALAGLGLGALRPVDHPERYVDLDADGLLDDWEEVFFAGRAVTPDGDEDLDGLDNRQECEGGTLPQYDDVDGDGLLDVSDPFPFLP